MKVSGQLHASAALHSGKEPLEPIGYKAGWAPEPLWKRCRRVKFPSSAGNQILIIRSSGP